MLSLSRKIKDLKSHIAEAYTKVTDQTFLNRAKNEINEQLTNKQSGTIAKEIQSRIFSNLPPKIGYLDEKTVPLYAAFNMSYNWVSGFAWWPTADMEGREVVYFQGAASGTGAQRIFRATRTSLDDKDSFIFENAPVKPKAVDTELTYIIGLGNDFMVAHGVDDKWYRFDTKYTSNSDKWTATDASGLKNVSGLCNVLWFSNVKRYLCERVQDTQLILSVYDENWSLQYEDIILDRARFRYSNHPEWTVSSSWYEGGTHASSMAYVAPKNALIVSASMWLGAKNQVGTYEIFDDNSGYTDYVPFTPQDLLTQNYFSKAAWHMGADYFEDHAHAPIGGDGTYRFFSGWSYSFITYDTLNNFFYYSRVVRDNSSNQFWRTALEDLDFNVKGGDIVYGKKPVYWTLMSPDTAPWSKQNFSPSIIYEGVYLKAESQKYGWSNVAVIPEKTDDPERVSVTAGSWKIGDANTTWCAGDGRYCCVKEPFSPDEVSWYTLRSDGTNYYVYRLGHRKRTDNTGVERDDYIYCPDTPCATFKGANKIPYDYFPQGIAWAYRSNKFGGEDKLILFVQSSSSLKMTHIKTDTENRWDGPEHNSIPRYIIFSTDGSYQEVNMSDEALAYWKSVATDAYPRIMYGSPCRSSFMDDDGQTVYLCSNPSWPQPRSCSFTCYKVVFEQDFSGYVSHTSLNGANGHWNGIECMGWCKTYGYFRTTSDRVRAIIDYSPTSIENAINHTGDVKRMYFGNNGSVGLVAYLQTTPIFLGGYYSVISPQEIYLTPNQDNYVYLMRDKSDYTKVNIKVFDHILGPTDQRYNINFSSILITRIKTNNKDAVEQEYYPIDYYGA